MYEFLVLSKVRLLCVAFLLLLLLIYVANLGKSFVAVWIGYEFVLNFGVALWVLIGVITKTRFWIEAAIVTSILGLAIPLWYLFFGRSK